MLITFFSLEKGVELDHHWVEFDDVRYHIQVTFFYGDNCQENISMITFFYLICMVKFSPGQF